MPSIITQFGLAAAFLLGAYDGTFTLEQLAEHGDFGHGTFNAIDGEMIALNGIFYRIDDTGKVSTVLPKVLTPIATVIKFKPDKTFILNHIRSYAQFQSAVRSHFVSQNAIYAIKVTAHFPKMLVRSEYAQSKPYKPIDISLPKTQQKFSLENTEGTLVGFFTPEVFEKMIISGFHFHYINDEKTAGGHVFDFSFETATVSIQLCREIRIKLPNTIDYDHMDLTPDIGHATSVAEKGKG